MCMPPEGLIFSRDAVVFMQDTPHNMLQSVWMLVEGTRFSREALDLCKMDEITPHDP